jgi:predicted kinase
VAGSLTIAVGIPGSGKSVCGEAGLQAAARAVFDVVVSSDRIREELTGDITNMERNVDVFAVVNERVRQALRDGLRVYVDATNLKPEFRATLREIARTYDAQAIAYIFTLSEDYDLCQKRNMERERNVPENVMLLMHGMFMEYCSPAQLLGEGWQPRMI